MSGGAEETREEMIARWEAAGLLDPACGLCQEDFYASDRLPCDVWAPRHRSGAACQSGGHPHCTCDSCF